MKPKKYKNKYEILTNYPPKRSQQSRPQQQRRQALLVCVAHSILLHLHKPHRIKHALLQAQQHECTNNKSLMCGAWRGAARTCMCTNCWYKRSVHFLIRYAGAGVVLFCFCCCCCYAFFMLPLKRFVFVIAICLSISLYLGNLLQISCAPGVLHTHAHLHTQIQWRTHSHSIAAVNREPAASSTPSAPALQWSVINCCCLVIANTSAPAVCLYIYLCIYLHTSQRLALKPLLALAQARWARLATQIDDIDDSAWRWRFITCRRFVGGDKICTTTTRTTKGKQFAITMRAC